MVDGEQTQQRLGLILVDMVVATTVILLVGRAFGLGGKLSTLLAVGTSICGAMPSLAWNVGMCFMMGVAAGGMLPVTYALLAEMMPSKHRGWSLVLAGANQPLEWAEFPLPEAESDTRRIEIDPTNPNRIYWAGNIPGRMGFVEVLTQ